LVIFVVWFGWICKSSLYHSLRKLSDEVHYLQCCCCCLLFIHTVFTLTRVWQDLISPPPPGEPARWRSFPPLHYLQCVQDSRTDLMTSPP
jgi:hypothetical protein